MYGRTLLISGGKVDREFAGEYLKKQSFDHIVCVDSGLDVAEQIGVKVDAFLGDFDSVTSTVLEKYQSQTVSEEGAQAVQYSKEKDYTDTSLAVRWLLEQFPSEIVILGATGGRLDHFLANVNILMEPLEKGIPAYIIDPYNRLYLIRENHRFRREDSFGKYVSFLPLTTQVTDVTLRGFVYPLDKETLCVGISRAVSNEFADSEAEITFSEGIVIVIESEDTAWHMR